MKQLGSIGQQTCGSTAYVVQSTGTLKCTYC